VLVLCLAQGVRKDEPTVPATTLRTLEVKGLIHLRVSRKKREVWRATDIGAGLIAGAGLLPELLHKRSEYGYTHSTAHAMVREPESTHGLTPC